MEDARLGKPASDQPVDRLAAGAVLLAAAAEVPPPQPANPAPKGVQRPDVGGHGMIGEVAGHDLPQPSALLVRRGMQAAAQGLLDIAQLGPQPVAPRLPVQGELAVPGPPRDMGEAQEVEGLRLAKAALATVRRGKAAELDQARLVRMQAQREAFQPRSQIRQKPLGIGPMLEAGDEVVGIAHHDDVAPGMAVSPLPRPQVEDVMQVDVGEQRRDHRTLRRPNRCRRHRPVFHHPDLQPFADQPDHAPVSDPMLDKTDQPIMADRISASRIQFTRVRVIPTANASSASCWPRPARKP
jgi:hypothetical protein